MQNTLRIAAICLLAAVAQTGIAPAKTASLQDRQQLAVAVANYINDASYRRVGTFDHSKAIQLGAAAIEKPFAIARWRASTGNAAGEVAFRFMCGRWNVIGITNSAPWQPSALIALGASKGVASRLVSGLASQRTSVVAFLKPAHMVQGC